LDGIFQNIEALAKLVDENEGEHAGSPLQSGRTRRFAPTERRDVLSGQTCPCPYHKSFARTSRD